MECNQHKGPNIATLDPHTEELVALFHPRRHRWDDHFERRDLQIVGRTAIGRGTVRLLKMNDPLRRLERAAETDA